MNAAPHERGIALLAAHCASLDPDTATARERLEDVLGAELARKLVFALTGAAHPRASGGGALRPRPVFAA
jgi:hypothetical protein